jgi:hypothetical protein
MGNPQVSHCLPIPEPMGTLTHDLHGFTCQNEPKMVEIWVRYSQFRWFSRNWLYLIQFSTKKHVLGHVLKVSSRRNLYPYLYPPVPLPVTRAGTKNPHISLINREMHRYSIPKWVMGKSSNGYGYRHQLIYPWPLKQAQEHEFWCRIEWDTVNFVKIIEIECISLISPPSFAFLDAFLVGKPMRVVDVGPSRLPMHLSTY